MLIMKASVSKQLLSLPNKLLQCGRGEVELEPESLREDIASAEAEAEQLKEERVLYALVLEDSPAKA